MFDIGISELLLIAIVGLVVIGPKDLPVVIRHGARYVRELRAVYSGLRNQMHQLVEEVGLEEVKQEITTIIDMHGVPQQAYDVNTLDQLKASAPRAQSDVKPIEAAPHAD